MLNDFDFKILLITDFTDLFLEILKIAHDVQRNFVAAVSNFVISPAYNVGAT